MYALLPYVCGLWFCTGVLRTVSTCIGSWEDTATLDCVGEIG